MTATLSALVIGPSGAGKSWLAATVPPPRLIIDLEGRGKYTPNGRNATPWNGVSDPMQLEKSASRTYITVVTTIDQLDSIRQWLRSGRHPFHSVAVDSLMEAQMRVADNVRPGTEALRTQDWGMLLRIMEQFVREVRDMVLQEGNPLHVAVFIAGAKHDGEYVKPMMQGQIAAKTPYWMDLVGYLEKVYTQDGHEERRLWIGQRPQNDLETKDGTHLIQAKFGPCIVEPDLEAIYEALNGA